MRTTSKHQKAGLLASAIWTSLSLTSAPVQSEQLEPAAASSVSSPPNTAPGGASVGHESSTPNPTAHEWSTKEASLTLALCRGTKLVIGPHSRVRRLPMIPVSLDSQEYAKSAFGVELLRGRIDVDIARDIRPMFALVVRAPRKVDAIVKTGRATISATDGDVTIAARSGRDMLSAIRERWRPLRVGKAITVNGKNPQGAQRNILSAPTLRIDAPVALAMGTTVTAQRLSWKPISGSTGYRLRLYDTVGDSPIFVREQLLKDSSLQIDHLKSGRYSATVTSIDAWNLESAPSAEVRFRIVEAIAPPGAVIVGNIIQLPVAERLQLLHTENMELSYGYWNSTFVAAPQSVGLYNSRPMQIRLRERGSNRETRVRLEPLVIVPTVEFAPARAIWPGTPVTITIETKQWDGSPAPRAGMFVPVVTINSQPTNVSWQETGGKMSGQIEKPELPGPWFVRVQLRDKHGRNMAQGFLAVTER